MKKYIVVLFIVLLILPLIAKEEVVFESALKDAVYVPLSTEGGDDIRYDGWWTLKFENGAVISIYCMSQGWPIRISKEKAAAISTGEIWWIGKPYVVLKLQGVGFSVKLKEPSDLK